MFWNKSHHYKEGPGAYNSLAANFLKAPFESYKTITCTHLEGVYLLVSEERRRFSGKFWHISFYLSTECDYPCLSDMFLIGIMTCYIVTSVRVT